ncbi:VanZ family protein [Arthrobacter sp. zg-Y1143]|uniref:VanZ family protein n=1 Tax=Arthrobacter sp. zg-Y1143 TaxID=3049065 RepID=UPI0024C39E11|nr:VanZ family protein [Arthrobacter sp. zg-Y1143]MDK1326454.1 VanZ family protein [Arthrobacter sp. zg-Y1143]
MRPHYEITAYPVVIPLAVVVFTVLLWRLHRRGDLTVPRVLVSAVMCVYGAGVIGNTLFPIQFAAGSSPRWGSLNLVPLQNAEWDDILQNILVFIPLGMLLPLISRIRSAPRVLLVGFLVSLTVELLQYANAVLWNGGHVADVNDLLANTGGAPLGYGIYRGMLLLPAFRRRLPAGAGRPG